MTTRKGVATIVANCKQTRFHFAEDSGSADVRAIFHYSFAEYPDARPNQLFVID
jgi:hypothetical protein